ILLDAEHAPKLPATPGLPALPALPFGKLRRVRCQSFRNSDQVRADIHRSPSPWRRADDGTSVRPETGRPSAASAPRLFPSPVRITDAAHGLGSQPVVELLQVEAFRLNVPAVGVPIAL